MRRRTILREPRLVHAAVGAVILAGPASAAFAATPPGTETNKTLKARLQSRRIGYGRAVVVRGHAPASAAGQTVALDYAPPANSSWQQIASSRVAANGSFRLTGRLQRSGQVRVTLAPHSAGAFTAVAADAQSTLPQRVAVQAALRLRHREHSVRGVGTIHVNGELLPRTAGKRVVLQGWGGRRWVTLTSTRTKAGGRFRLGIRVTRPGRQGLRVRFPGDHSNAAVTRSAGHVTVFRQTTASWYEDGGTTACGFHAYYGVANLSLPCGAHVTFSYGGRQVTATVDDRGPYVGGRAWDLNQNTAAALGFAGVARVWSSS